MLGHLHVVSFEAFLLVIFPASSGAVGVKGVLASVLTRASLEGKK